MRKLLAVVLVVPALAFAQTEPKTEKVKTQSLIFEEDEVLGTREVPADGVITTRCSKRSPSIIKVRADFKEKLLSSVHEM